MKAAAVYDRNDIRKILRFSFIIIDSPLLTEDMFKENIKIKNQKEKYILKFRMIN